MRWLLVVAVLSACGPGVSSNAEFRPRRMREHVNVLVEATATGDVPRIRRLLRDSVTLGGVWFPDTKCMIKFAVPGTVHGAALDELANCLATLKLERAGRSDSLPDVALFTYSPGVEVQVRLADLPSGPWLSWIGYVARRDLTDALPTISPHVLEALRIEGDRNPELPDPQTYPELRVIKEAHAWVKLCVDATGSVTSTSIRKASSPRAARAFTAAMEKWRFNPFILGTQPAPVCSLVEMVHPPRPAGERAILPLPLPASQANAIVVDARMLGKHIGGRRIPFPSDEVMRLTAAAGKQEALVAAQYCVNESGRVSYAAMLRSSGVPAFDREVIAAIRTWTYKPYLDDGRAVPVCSSVVMGFSRRVN